MQHLKKKIRVYPFNIDSSARGRQRNIFLNNNIILAYLPIFLSRGLKENSFHQWHNTLSYAITGSMILALTAIPVLML